MGSPRDGEWLHPIDAEQIERWKRHATAAKEALGSWDTEMCECIITLCDEVLAGRKQISELESTLLTFDHEDSTH